jgi:two-component system response regulator MprA
MSRVLVAEDSGTILLLLRKRLELAGHEVITAADGIDALERIGSEKPEVIVLDAMMPRMSGLEVLHRIRSDGDDTPVVIASAHRDAMELADADELGVVAVLTKPFDWDELLGAIDAALG